VNSTDLEGFSEWQLFLRQAVNNTPRDNGIYVLRMAEGRKFGQLRGESDILYIGSSKSRGGIKQRLRQYLAPGPTQWTNKRVKSIIDKYTIEFAWRITNRPRVHEHDLLLKYIKDHDELPPLNRATIRLLEDAASLSCSFTVTKP